jgi:hypothetical protein
MRHYCALTPVSFRFFPLGRWKVQACSASGVDVRTTTHYRKAMSAIDPVGLRKAMELSGTTPTQLARELDLSLTYVGDMTSGRRSLKRNPALRSRIAKALNVPIHWIERPSKTEDAA